jgi:hypothetical protein
LCIFFISFLVRDAKFWAEHTCLAKFLFSSLREKVLEHLFVGELLPYLWRSRRTDIEALRAEVDFRGSWLSSRTLPTLALTLANMLSAVHKYRRGSSSPPVPEPA